MDISILIIDDNIHFLMDTKEFLESKGMTITKVISKEDEAIKEVKNNFYDIIIIDMELHGNMYAGLNIIKSIKSRENIGFIVVSGHNVANLLLDTLSCGILRYLVKPFDLDVLHAHILDLIKYRNFALLEMQEQNILSAQQEIVLKKLSKGYKADLIASELGITLSTVKHHKKKIIKKLCVSTLNEAIFIGAKMDLI